MSASWNRSLGLAWLLTLVAASCGTVEEPKLPDAWGKERAERPLSHADCVALALHSAPIASAWRARRMAAEVADLRAEATHLEVEVRRGYDRLVVARLRVELRRASQVVFEQQRAGLERFVTAGIEPKIALERADAELMQARAEAMKAETEARLLEIEFAFALGFARPVHLVLSDPVTPQPAAPVPGLEPLLVRAAEERQELVAAKERYASELERAHLQAERVRFLPTVGAGPRLESGEVRGVASLDVELPIFDGGGAGDQAQNAALLASASELRRQAQRVAGEVALAHERGALARALEQASLPLAAARRALRERVERLFTAGEATFQEVILARREAIEAELTALDAALAVAEARLDLAAALGAVSVR